MKIAKYISAIAITLITTACSDSLDTENLYGKSLETFYKTPTDINEAMAGVYNAIYTSNIFSEEQMASNLMDNIMLGGGGADDKAAKRVDNFEDPEEDTYRDMWVQSYSGIARCNAIIEKTELADFSTFFETVAEADKFKKQAIGEAYFMRAFFYFRLAKFFGGVPLIAAVSDPKNVARGSYSDTFARITSDLKSAIEIMPATPLASIPGSEYGHANKWIAQAYMARVYLFYTGYMTNIEKSATDSLPLVDGGSIGATEVTAYLNDCMNNSGYALLADFRNLWPYSEVNIAAKSNIYPYGATEQLAWAGQDGLTTRFGTGNTETMFVQRFSFGDWSWDNGPRYTNRMCLFNSMRENSELVPFGTGWGWLTVSTNLWNNWDDTDLRKKGSILKVGEASEGTAGYVPDKGDHETGFFNKKYTSLQFRNAKNELSGLFVQLYSWTNNDMQLRHAQDFIFMRFADVLLMHSEITKTSTGLNAVRSRAGLPSVAYTLDAIKAERLHEFAFEALHWFDIVRWGDLEAAFAGTLSVRNTGASAIYSVKYRPETKALVSIPETEIRLSNGVYTQNPGW